MDQLIEPPPIAFSFGAPGWYVIGAALLLLLSALLVLAMRRYRANRFRRRALTWLAEQEGGFIKERSYADWVYVCNCLIKQLAMRDYGRARTASKRSDEWTNYLNETCRKVIFHAEDALLLSRDLYRPSRIISAAEARTFSDKTKYWIKKHHLFSRK